MVSFGRVFGSQGAKVLVPWARVDPSLLCLSSEGAALILTGWSLMSQPFSLSSTSNVAATKIITKIIAG